MTYEPTEPTSLRGPYGKPTLTALGDLAEMTNHAGYDGREDGGHDYYGNPLGTHARY